MSRISPRDFSAAFIVFLDAACLSPRSLCFFKQIRTKFSTCKFTCEYNWCDHGAEREESYQSGPPYPPPVYVTSEEVRRSERLLCCALHILLSHDGRWKMLIGPFKVSADHCSICSLSLPSKRTSIWLRVRADRVHTKFLSRPSPFHLNPRQSRSRPRDVPPCASMNQKCLRVKESRVHPLCFFAHWLQFFFYWRVNISDQETVLNQKENRGHRWKRCVL